MRQLLIVAPFAFIGLTGCTTIHYMPVAVSQASIGPKERIVGMGSGVGESLEEAIKNAIGKSGADTMMNVFIDKEYSCTDGIGGIICAPTTHTRIFGTLIKYQQ